MAKTNVGKADIDLTVCYRYKCDFDFFRVGRRIFSSDKSLPKQYIQVAWASK